MRNTDPVEMLKSTLNWSTVLALEARAEHLHERSILYLQIRLDHISFMTGAHITNRVRIMPTIKMRNRTAKIFAPYYNIPVLHSQEHWLHLSSSPPRTNRPTRPTSLVLHGKRRGKLTKIKTRAIVRL